MKKNKEKRRFTGAYSKRGLLTIYKTTQVLANLRCLNIGLSDERQENLTKNGFSLIEVILSSSIFVILATAFIGAFITSGENSSKSGAITRALFLAEEGLEAARSIKEESFGNLTVGTHGFATSSGNEWIFSGTSDQTEIFSRQIQISDIDADRKMVTSTVSWSDNTGPKSVVFATRFTNWQSATVIPICQNQADYLVIDSSSARFTSGDRRLLGLFVNNTAVDCSIIIDKIMVAWNPLTPTRQIRKVQFAPNTSVWIGSAPSGTNLDIINYTLQPTSGQIDTIYDFSGRMNGRTFNFIFTMSDGTTKIAGPVSP